MMWMICLFGGLGAMARYVLDVSIQRGWNRENRRTNRNFPLSTLVINGVASLCAGIAMMSYYSQSVDMDTVMMFVVGFLGGFSTFSTALNEVVSLIRQRRFTLALGYGIATVAVPLICVAAGFGSSRKLQKLVQFRHCAACQSGVIFTLHGRSLSNVKEI